MSVFPPGDVWDANETFLAFQHVLIPGAFVVICLNLFGVITFYCFKTKFPATVLAWVGICNVLYASWLIIKWAPWSVGFPIFVVNAAGGTPGCAGSLFVDVFNFYAIVGLNTLVAITLYFSIIMKINLSPEVNPEYRRWYLISFAVYLIVIPLIVTIYVAKGAANTGAVGFCTAGQLTYFEVVPQCLLVAIQIGLLASVLVRVKTIIRAATSQDSTGGDVRMLYLLVRCVCIIIAEIFDFGANYAAVLISYIDIDVTVPEYKWILLSAVIAPCIDAAVLILGNRDLTRFIRKQIDSQFSISGSSEDSGRSVKMTGHHSTPAGSVSSTARSDNPEVV